METFGARLQRFLKARNLSANEFARRVGKSSAYISLVANGERLADGNLKSRDAALWAAVLGVTEADLLGEDRRTPRPEFLTLPLGAVLRAVGAVRLASDEVRLWQPVSADSERGVGERAGQERPRRRRYVVEVVGDCMVPEIKSGDLVKFDPDLAPEDGDWVVATIEGERAIVKSLEIRGAVQRLLPLNGDPLVIDETVRIVGVVVSREEPAPRFRKRGRR